MAFYLIIDGKEIRRELEGDRRLAEILSQEEYREICSGVRVALTESGGLLDITSPILPDQKVRLLSMEDEEVKKIFADLFAPAEKERQGLGGK